MVCRWVMVVTISSWLNFGRRSSPGRGSAAGRKFLAPRYYGLRAVFASLRALFSCTVIVITEISGGVLVLRLGERSARKKKLLPPPISIFLEGDVMFLENKIKSFYDCILLHSIIHLIVKYRRCASGCVVRVPDLQLGGCRFESRPGLLRTKVYSAFHPSGVGKWVPVIAGKANAGMAHSDCGWTCGYAGKTVKSLENTCHTWALLRWWFTTKRRYIK